MTAPRTDIRSFEPGNLPAMQGIREAAFEPVFRSFRGIVGEEIAALAFAHADADAEQARLPNGICGADSGHHALVATVGGEIVGFVTFTIDADKRTGEIGLNAVHPQHAGKGAGTRMYEHAMGRAKEARLALASIGTGADLNHAPRGWVAESNPSKSASSFRGLWCRTTAPSPVSNTP